MTGTRGRVSARVDVAPSVLLAALGSREVLRRMRLTRLDTLGLAARGATARFTAHLAAAPGGTALTCELRRPWPLNLAVSRDARRIVARTRAAAARLRAAPVIVGTAVLRDGRVLAQQRHYPARDAGRWELPGGRVEPGESEVDAVRRECMEELGVAVHAGEPLGVDVALPSGSLLRVYTATLAAPGAVPEAREHRAVRWLSATQLYDVPWLEADLLLLPQLVSLLRCGGPENA